MTKERNESNCANEVMEVVGERIVSATNRRTRIEALATIVDIPYFSAYNVSSRTQHCALLNCFLQVLLSLPGVTRYLIHQARLFARGGLDLDVTHTRVRYNGQAIEFFLSFLARLESILN